MLWNGLETSILDRTSKFISISDSCGLSSMLLQNCAITWICVFSTFIRYFVLGLPTGSTPLKMYESLVEYYKAGQISFKFVKTFNMDEYASKLYRIQFCAHERDLWIIITFVWISKSYFCVLIIRCGWLAAGCRYSAKPFRKLPLFYVE